MELLIVTRQNLWQTVILRLMKYKEIFAPETKTNIFRILASLDASLGWVLQPFDVKIAFLHGDLDEEVYTEIPPNFCVTSC